MRKILIITIMGLMTIGAATVAFANVTPANDNTATSLPNCCVQQLSCCR